VAVYLNSEVQIAATTMNSGDYIIADLDGVVCCPKELEEKVLEIIPDIAAADERRAEAIRGRMSVEEGFATFREIYKKYPGGALFRRHSESKFLLSWTINHIIST
jgi:regulator of RNase E activity RraA